MAATLPGPTYAERLSMRVRRYESSLEAGRFADAATEAQDIAWLLEMHDDEDAATLWHCNAEAARERVA